MKHGQRARHHSAVSARTRARRGTVRGKQAGHSGAPSYVQVVPESDDIWLVGTQMRLDTLPLLTMRRASPLAVMAMSAGWGMRRSMMFGAKRREGLCPSIIISAHRQWMAADRALTLDRLHQRIVGVKDAHRRCRAVGRERGCSPYGAAEEGTKEGRRKKQATGIRPRPQDR